jgi:hypothetical protein
LSTTYYGGLRWTLNDWRSNTGTPQGHFHHVVELLCTVETLHSHNHQTSKQHKKTHYTAYTPQQCNPTTRWSHPSRRTSTAGTWLLSVRRGRRPISIHARVSKRRDRDPGAILTVLGVLSWSERSVGESNVDALKKFLSAAFL